MGRKNGHGVNRHDREGAALGQYDPIDGLARLMRDALPNASEVPTLDAGFEGMTERLPA